MDVSLFRPFQQMMVEKIDTLRTFNGPDAISITKFHKIMMPIYLRCMNPDTVSNGFRKAGIHPFKRENDADVKQEAFHSKEGVTLDGHVEHSIETVPAHNNCKSAVDDDTFSEGELPALDKPPPRLSCEIIDLTDDVIIQVTEDDIDLSSEGVTHFRAATSVAHAAEAETAVDQVSVPESGSSEDEVSVSGAVVEEPQWRGPTDTEVYEELCTVACKPRRECQCDDICEVPPFVSVLLEDNPHDMVLVDDEYIRMVPY